ncbi:MAG: radical SAM protein [Elusimicrobia bacterium]|nr:radical SAM protein [Elusimicrobiota bacterium]
MRIILVNPPSTVPMVRDMAGGLGFTSSSPVSSLPPLEFAWMAATLQRKGHEVKIIDPDVCGYGLAAVYENLAEYKPEAVVCAVSLPTLYKDCSFLAGIRKYCAGRIIAKTSISYQPVLKEILQKSAADICVYGECELNIGELILGSSRAGAVWLENGEITSGGDSIIQDLDSLPLPARGLLSNDKYAYSLLGIGTTTMQTSRGCPFPCAYYCAYPLSQGRLWRRRTPEHVLREIEDIVVNHGITKILFRDATFTMDKERASAICDLIISRKIKIQWWCETRVDCLDESLMRKMKAAGCAGMNIGVESGDSEVMETQAKIGMTFGKLKAIREAARALGLRLHFLLMVGLPQETKRSIYETYKLITELKPETIGVTIVTPYPGTPLYHEAKRKGYIETENWADFGGHNPVMHTAGLTAGDLSFARRSLNSIFYYLQRPGLASRFKAVMLILRLKLWALK